MSMSDAYTRCEELGIPVEAPDALEQLWAAISPAERAEIFPHVGASGPAAIAVVITDRRHPLYGERGTVGRTEPDSFGRVRVYFKVQGGDGGPGETWSAIETFALSPVTELDESEATL